MKHSVRTLSLITIVCTTRAAWAQAGEQGSLTGTVTDAQGGALPGVTASAVNLDTNVTTYRISDGDPLSAGVEVHCTSGLGRGDWQTRIETASGKRSTATAFLVSQRLNAFEGDEQVYSRVWELTFRRDNV